MEDETGEYNDLETEAVLSDMVDAKEKHVDPEKDEETTRNVKKKAKKWWDKHILAWS